MDIFKRENGKIEALLKMMFSSGIYYFAVQDDKLMLINIDEVQYQKTIEYMFASHECLKACIETEIQKTRRTNNIQYLSQNNITANNNLICFLKDEEVKLKGIEEICKRAIACLLTIQIACDINNGNYEESLKYFVSLYKKYDVEEFLNSKEKRIIDGSYTKQDVIDLDWAYEAYWMLCWCLGLVDDIKDASNICDCEKAISFVMDSDSLKEFKSKCNLRSISQILDMYDLYYRYNWAINNKQVDASTLVGNLNPSIVIERRRALEWIVSDKEDWYDISFNT